MDRLDVIDSDAAAAAAPAPGSDGGYQPEVTQPSPTSLPKSSADGPARPAAIPGSAISSHFCWHIGEFRRDFRRLLVKPQKLRSLT